METKTPFSQEDLKSIFKISLTAPDRITSRESSILEFKESFNFGSLAKYAKTSVAFANTKGGYFVFGITDKPRRLCGLTEKSSEQFLNIDSEKISEFLNAHFSPAVDFM